MAAPVLGCGYLRVIDVLQKVSRFLFEPVIVTVLPAPILAGSQTVNIASKYLYVGAKLVVGVTGGDLEVITLTGVTPTTFTATFANNHAAGEPLLGTTFPIRYPTDPLFTQDEMIGYLSKAINDYLTDCPLVINIADLTVPPSQQNVALPADSMKPVRVAAQSFPLRETSQSNLDSMQYDWNLAALSQPKVFFRDKIPIQNVGIAPRAGNKVPLQVVYEQRQATIMDWGDGFLLPDPFLIYPMYRTLSFAYSKDGEARQPSLARYFEDRYKAGVTVGQMYLETINDPNA